MIYPILFINLFFVPVIPLYLYYHFNRRPLLPSLELLFQYCAVVSLNHAAAHAISFLLLKLTRSGYTLDSARYTLIAILASVLLFMAYVVIKYLRPEVHITRIEECKVEEHEQNETSEV